MRSIYLQKLKQVFDVSKLPAEAYATSLGLPGVPKIKFLKKVSLVIANDRNPQCQKVKEVKKQKQRLSKK